MSSYDYLVVGAGFTGATFAHLKRKAGFKVKVIDQRDHIGGNAYDEFHEPMYVHKYGPHIFHTNSQRIFDFLSQFTDWRKYQHRVIASLGMDFQRVPVPFNFRSIEICFPPVKAEAVKKAMRLRFRDNQRVTLSTLKEIPDGDIQYLAEFVYDRVFKDYTLKMWGMKLEDLGPTVADRVPIIAGYDDRYFNDSFQYMPKTGYTKIFERMLEGVEVQLNTSYAHSMEGDATKIFYTGSIDEYHMNMMGPLPYRGLDINSAPNMSIVNLGEAGTLNFCGMHSALTRVSSMSRLSGIDPGYESDIVVSERPSSTSRYYPLTTDEARSRYHKYEEATYHLDWIKFAGRLGSYQYLNMDQAIAQAIKCAEEF